jgi:hypothetical protein
MPTRPDDERRKNLLRAELSDIGLNSNKQYRLFKKGPKWVLEFSKPITPQQVERAEELLAMIMNR